MRLVALLFVAILSGSAYSQTNFGDKVVACVSRRTTASSPNSEIQAAFEACGSQVEADAADAAVAASLQSDEAAKPAKLRGTQTPPQASSNPYLDMLQKEEQSAKNKAMKQASENAPALRQEFTDADFARLAHDDADDVKRLIPALVTLAAISALALAGYFLFGPIKRLSARAFSSQTTRRFIVLHAAWVIGLIFLSASLPSVMERLGLGFDGDRDTNHTLALAFITPWLVLAFWRSWKWATNSTKQEI